MQANVVAPAPAPEAAPVEGTTRSPADHAQRADPADDAQAADWSGDFALVTTGGGLHLMFGDAHPDNLALGHGRPRLASRPRHLVHATIPDRAVPPQAEAWRRQRVEIVTELGARCAGSVRSFEYRVDMIPDAYEDALWAGRTRGPDDDARAADARSATPLRGYALANAVWALGAPVVTGRVRLDDSSTCEGTPLYARRASRAPARVASELNRVPRRAEVMAAFRDLPGYRAAQQDYAHGSEGPAVRRAGGPARWEDYNQAMSVQAFAFEDNSGVLVSVTVPWGSCGDWGPALWAVFRLPPDSAAPPELVSQSSEVGPTAVHLIVDSGGDEPDYIIDDGWPSGMSVMRGDQSLSSWSPDFHGCGC